MITIKTALAVMDPKKAVARARELEDLPEVLEYLELCRLIFPARKPGERQFPPHAAPKGLEKAQTVPHKAKPQVKPKPKRRQMSAAERKAVSLRMKNYWAKQRAKKAAATQKK